MFTSFAVGGDKSYGNLEKSPLSESEKSFEVGFSALDYAGASNGRYFYRMNGFDNEWKENPGEAPQRELHQSFQRELHTSG